MAAGTYIYIYVCIHTIPLASRMETWNFITWPHLQARIGPGSAGSSHPQQLHIWWLKKFCKANWEHWTCNWLASHHFNLCHDSGTSPLPPHTCTKELVFFPNRNSTEISNSLYLSAKFVQAAPASWIWANDAVMYCRQFCSSVPPILVGPNCRFILLNLYTFQNTFARFLEMSKKVQHFV